MSSPDPPLTLTYQPPTFTILQEQAYPIVINLTPKTPHYILALALDHDVHLLHDFVEDFLAGFGGEDLDGADLVGFNVLGFVDLGVGAGAQEVTQLELFDQHLRINDELFLI